MSVTKATEQDLRDIFEWLKHEYTEDGEGFWCNRNIISKALNSDLWSIHKNGKAVAFQVGNYAADIACVTKQWRRKGLGTQLLAASIERAYRDNVNVLSVECEPRTSWPFWESQGFKRFGYLDEFDQIFARLILQRDLPFPKGLPSIPVHISFFPENALYRPNIEPISTHKIQGTINTNRTILLPKRIIGLENHNSDRDIAIKIRVDDEEIIFRKAKHKEAMAAGVQHDSKSDAFFIDTITTPKQLPHSLDTKAVIDHKP